jgi:hypothetical protein
MEKRIVVFGRTKVLLKGQWVIGIEIMFPREQGTEGRAVGQR